MENVVSISHATDIDGVGSSALIMMKYGMPSSHIFFADYKVENLEMIEREMAKVLKENTTLFVTDLAVNDKTLPVFLRIVRKVKAKNGKVFWFDHHPWTTAAEKRLAPLCDVAIFGENHKYCGAEITRKELGFKDKFTEHFRKIVHYSDFNIRPKKIGQYATVGFYALSIAYYHMKSHSAAEKGLRHIAEVIASGRLTDDVIKRDANKFRKLNDRQVVRMLKSVYLGKSIALGFAGDIQKTYACMKLIEKTGKEIGIYVNLRDGRGHMRSLRSDVSVLAGRFNGGGHPHAAGFSPDLKRYNNFKTEHDRRRLLTDIEMQMAIVKPRKSVSRSSRKPSFG